MAGSCSPSFSSKGTLKGTLSCLLDRYLTPPFPLVFSPQLKDLAEKFLQNDEWMYKLSLNAVAAAAAIKVSQAGSRMGSFVHVSDVTLRAKQCALIVHS